MAHSPHIAFIFLIHTIDICHHIRNICACCRSCLTSHSNSILSRGRAIKISQSCLYSNGTTVITCCLIIYKITRQISPRCPRCNSKLTNNRFFLSHPFYNLPFPYSTNTHLPVLEQQPLESPIQTESVVPSSALVLQLRAPEDLPLRYSHY